MKVLLISDVHANLPALEAVAAAEPDAELILFAGDMVDFGYYPHEVIDWFRSHNCICVKGNHDRELLARLRAGEDKPQEGELPNYAQHNLSLMTEEDIRYLEEIPEEARFEIDGVSYYMAHFIGAGDAVSEQCFEYHHLKMEFIPTFEKVWREKCPGNKTRRRCIILGHSHRPIIIHRGGGGMVLNPGALGYQLGADCFFSFGADYMVIQDGDVMPRHVEYDTEDLIQKVHSVALEETARRTADNLFRTALHPDVFEDEMNHWANGITLYEKNVLA